MKTNLILTVAIALGVATASAAPVFYPSAPDQPRVQFLKSINGSKFFSATNGGVYPPGYVPKKEKETDPLFRPYGLATSKGKIYVADSGSQTVRVFDLNKKLVGTIGKQKPGKLELPINITIDANGNKYVTDSVLNKIMVYDAADNFVKSIGQPEKMKPTDVVVSNGKLYVTDVANSQIVVINPETGSEITRISQEGAGDADLHKPTNLAIDTSGNLIVGDTMGAKIAMYTADGKFIRKVGSLGDTLGSFARPKGVAVDKENRLYAVDSAFENIQIFDKDGKLLLPFGVAGNDPGGMNMPIKVVIDSENVDYFKKDVAPGYGIDYLIFVTNQFGDNKVNVYGFLKKL